MLNPEAFADVYDRKMSGESVSNLTGLSNSIMRYLKYFKGIIPVFFILSFTPFVKTNKFIKTGLFFSLLNLFLSYLNSASRFALLTDLFLMSFLYAMFYRYFRPKVKKIANIIAVSIGSILILGTVGMTLQRFGENSGYSKTLDYTLSLYFGEGFLNFNGDMWNMPKTTDGENCLAYFIDKINGDEEPGRKYLRLESIVHRRMNVYYTFIGDYYTDLGRYGTVFLVIILAVIFSKILRAKPVFSISSLLLLSTYVKVLLLGITYWTYLNYSMEFVVNVIVAIVFYFCSSAKTAKKVMINYG